MNTHESNETLNSDEISADSGDSSKYMFRHKNITLINGDCMDYMAALADRAFSLAVVDPPYGIGRSGKPRSTSKHGGHKGFEKKGWDKSRPNSSYFKELFRVSHNQIVWGANYFPEFFQPSSGWILWDKGQRIDQADGELAFSSINRPLRIFTLNRVSLMIEGTIHPTQKPVALYRWLLTNYARPGDTILDTHLGSGSSAIAAYELGFEFVGIELDTDYYNAAVERFKKHLLQPKLPLKPETKPTQGELI